MRWMGSEEKMLEEFWFFRLCAIWFKYKSCKSLLPWISSHAPTVCAGTSAFRGRITACKWTKKHQQTSERGKKNLNKNECNELNGEESLLWHFFFVFAKTSAWQVTLKCHINFSVSQKRLRNVRTLEQHPVFFRLCPDLYPQTAASDPATTSTTTTTPTITKAAIVRVVKLSHKSRYYYTKLN